MCRRLSLALALYLKLSLWLILRKRRIGDLEQVEDFSHAGSLGKLLSDGDPVGQGRDDAAQHGDAARIDRHLDGPSLGRLSGRDRDRVGRSRAVAVARVGGDGSVSGHGLRVDRAGVGGG